MKKLCLILYDQLSLSSQALYSIDKKNDIVCLFELKDYFQKPKHHKKKIVFMISAMRHFAEELRKKKFQVHYVQLDDKKNSQCEQEELKKAIERFSIDKIVLTEPSDYKTNKQIQAWHKTLGVAVDVKKDIKFICEREEFKAWSESYKQLRMENFYRMMRKKHNILIVQGKPVGGKWNYDKQNRDPLQEGIEVPPVFSTPADSITKTVMTLVDKIFADHFGVGGSLPWAVTRAGALRVLKYFINKKIVNYGPYQDAMADDNPWLFHSHLSLYLNNGLLLPEECINAACHAYDAGAPIHSVEGFVRQILGWREFMRGIYWLQMPEYANLNFFQAKRPLPDFYWTGKTSMNCLKQAIHTTQENAYAHHIQRLMVLGNFAMLISVAPKEICHWFHVVYIDAYEWVEMTNVMGMGIYADGGLYASKPYASSGAYINKMSNHCSSCNYDVKLKSGKRACPFNYLYWNFLIKNKAILSGNLRMKMIYAVLSKMSEKRIHEIEHDARAFLEDMDS